MQDVCEPAAGAAFDLTATHLKRTAAPEVCPDYPNSPRMITNSSDGPSRQPSAV